MRKLLIVIPLALIIFIIAIGFWGTRNLDTIRSKSGITAQEMGLEIMGCEGYQWDPFYGAMVWYIFKRRGGSDILYEGCFLQRPFTKEIHLYNFRAVDAISP